MIVAMASGLVGLGLGTGLLLDILNQRASAPQREGARPAGSPLTGPSPHVTGPASAPQEPPAAAPPPLVVPRAPPALLPRFSRAPPALLPRLRVLFARLGPRFLLYKGPHETQAP